MTYTSHYLCCPLPRAAILAPRAIAPPWFVAVKFELARFVHPFRRIDTLCTSVSLCMRCTRWYVGIHAARHFRRPYPYDELAHSLLAAAPHLFWSGGRRFREQRCGTNGVLWGRSPGCSRSGWCALVALSLFFLKADLYRYVRSRRLLLAGPALQLARGGGAGLPWRGYMPRPLAGEASLFFLGGMRPRLSRRSRQRGCAVRRSLRGDAPSVRTVRTTFAASRGGGGGSAKARLSLSLEHTA